MVSIIFYLFLNFEIGWWLKELDNSVFFRKVASIETLNGQNKSDESWTSALIMCLGGPNLVELVVRVETLFSLCDMVDL